MAEALYGQGAFQNLDFESSLIPPDQPSGTFVSPGVAFPGWLAYIGTNQADFIFYNNITLSAANISVLTTNYDPIPALEGTFSAFLQGSLVDWNRNGLVPWEVSLRQTGLLPVTAQSLTFMSGPTTPMSSISVTLAGQELALILFQTTPGYTVYGADVSAFAGQLAELRFTARAFYPPPPSSEGMNLWLLDSINFSDQPIPEPGTISLMGLGILILSLRRRIFSVFAKEKVGRQAIAPGL